MAAIESPGGWESTRSRSSTGGSTLAARRPPGAIRESASRVPAPVRDTENRIRAMQTVDLASAGYPLSFAFDGAANGINPYINILNRLQVVQFEDFEGKLKTLAYEPTVTEGRGRGAVLRPADDC